MGEYSRGGGISDPQSAEFQQLAAELESRYQWKPFIAVYASQKVKKTGLTGQATTRKVRILAATHLDADSKCHLLLLKPAQGKDPVTLKFKTLYRSGILRRGSKSGTQIDVRFSEESVTLSLSTETERDFFIATCEKNFKGRRATAITPAMGVRLSSVDSSPGRGARVQGRQPSEEQKPGLLSQEDDEALLVIMDRYSGGFLGAGGDVPSVPSSGDAGSPQKTSCGSADARLLRDRVAYTAKELQTDNETAILDSKRKWSDIDESFALMALELSNVQMRLIQVTNNLGKKSQQITTVERERSLRDQSKKNREVLIRELNYLNDRISDAQSHIRLLDSASFEVGERGNLNRALEFFEEYEGESLESDYDISALHEIKTSLDNARSRAASRLTAYLQDSFKTTGSRLKATATRRKGLLMWKTHGTYHQKWIELRSLMPYVIVMGTRHLMGLCRDYTDAMKAPYRGEISSYYKELKSQLQKKKHKPMFYIGQDLKDIKGLELLDVQMGMQGSSQAPSSRYAGSDSGVISVGRSSNGSDEGDDTPASRLEQLGVVVYSERNAAEHDMASGASPSGALSASRGSGGSVGSRGSYERNFYVQSDDGVSVTHTHKTADGKEKVLPHSALITSIVMSVEVILSEQEFIESMFGLNGEPSPSRGGGAGGLSPRSARGDQDADLVRMLDELFCDEKNFGSGGAANGEAKHLIVAEVSRAVDYMHSRCDMMSLLPVSIVVSQLQDAMKTRSTFINDFLKQIQGEVDRHILVWQGKQEASIQKFSCDVKHCVVLPSYVRFPVFIKRLEDMCRPIPPDANYTKLQEQISVLYKLMRDNLEMVSRKDKKYADFFYYKNAAYHLDYLRDVKNCGSNLAKKLIKTQIKEDFDKWVTLRDEKQLAYIKDTLLQDAFKPLFEYIDGVQDCLKSRKADEIPLQGRFYPQTIRELLHAHARTKHVKSNIDTVLKRLHKHFFEHPSSRKMETFVRSLYPVTLEALKHYITSKWEALANILMSCYQGIVAECSTRQVRDLLASMSPAPVTRPEFQLQSEVSTFAGLGRPPSGPPSARGLH